MDGKFTIGVREFAEHTKRDLDVVTRSVVLEAFSSVVLMTPVDEGRARGNWQPTVNVPASGELEVFDKTGAVTLGKIEAMQIRAGDVFMLTNCLPYIGDLEFGGYPVPVKRGTYVKGVGYVVKSEGGYSKQAPAGMVRVTVDRIDTIMRNAVSKVKR